ncbi:hypothetical protein GGQ13_002983 [Salinibacter ruber]|uniref:hypothetical protein n=1 Tax=Salinibacter ruber TaxID=146919 RepID=UPI00216801E7|nr:hypothetical protein [Salinibacter ruber]MCS4139528.1 hypothetical protein [Salinibacter ruber]
MSDDSFGVKYRDLEDLMRTLAEEEGDVFVPSPEPEGPVQYLFICMEPSLGGRSAQEVHDRIEAGARNFLNSVEDFILHFCARRYLCDSGERYHVTDVSKGAMPVSSAGANRRERYDRWYSLLKEEIDLVGASDAHCYAVGKSVDEFLSERDFQWPFTYLLHYSPQAARARNKGIEGNEDRFETFQETVSADDVLSVAEQTLEASSVPSRFQEEALSRLEERGLTPSQKKLIFNYRLAFEE